jgi:hypothetical protein
MRIAYIFDVFKLRFDANRILLNNFNLLNFRK